MTSYLTTGGEELVSRLADEVYDGIKSFFVYTINYEQYVDDLEVESAKLGAELCRIDVLIKNKARGNINIIFNSVLLFQTRAQDKKSEAEKHISECKLGLPTDDDNKKPKNLPGDKSCFVPNLFDCFSRYQKAKKAHGIYQEAKKLVGEAREINKGNIATQRVYNPVPETLAASYKATVPSREAYRRELKDALHGDEVFVMGVLGEAGVGKTMLVNRVAVDIEYDTEQYFKGVVTIRDKHKWDDPSYVQQVIAESLTDGSEFVLLKTVDGRARWINTLLSDHDFKVLIIIDNVGKKIDLDEIGIPRSKCCRVVVVTRSSQVFENMGMQKVWEFKTRFDADESNALDENHAASSSNHTEAAAKSRRKLLPQPKMLTEESYQSTINTLRLDVESLEIRHSEDQNQWKISSTVAISLSVWDLYIKGMVSREKLLAGEKYGAYLVYKFTSNPQGFDNLLVGLRVGTDDRRRCLIQGKIYNGDAPVKRADDWLEIHIGSFDNDELRGGDAVQLVVYDDHFGAKKVGLVVKGIEIRPEPRVDA